MGRVSIDGIRGYTNENAPLHYIPHKFLTLFWLSFIALHERESPSFDRVL